MKPNRKLKKSHSSSFSSSKLKLKEVIGLTTKNANGLASNVSGSRCVYVAGCVVVVYNVESGSQSHLVVSNRMPKPLSCVAMSKDGGFVAAGESGHQAAVLVWDCVSLAFLSELKSHQHGVACSAFSPDGKHLVSVGFPHDGYICLWDSRSGMLVTKLKACSSCSSVESVCFSSDAKFIVTAGKKHLKFWTVGSSARPRANAGAKSLAMHGKAINLGYQKGCSFVAVTSPVLTNSSLVNRDQAGGILPIYALTDAGVLYLLHSGLSIRNSVDLKVKKAFALSTSNKLIACACNNGVVKLFTIESLEYSGSLHHTEMKRCKKEDDMDCLGKWSSMETTVFIWDIQDIDKATRFCVLVSHSACIWDIKNLPCEKMHDPCLACVARGCSGGVSFATCSADGTIRFWDLALQPVSSIDDLTLATNHNFLLTETVKATCLVSAGVFERDSVELGISVPGFRSLAISSDGKHLAAGDCQGNLHVYNLFTSDYICVQDAHDAEILSLSFSLSSKKDVFSEEILGSYYFLASGGRDRMIHLYDVKRNFDIIGSVDDHSAAVTSVKLISDGCKILSCSADRSLILRDVAVTDTDCKISRCNHQMASFGAVYDMAVNPTMDVAVTVGEDKKINILNIATGKLIRSFKQEGESGDLVKVIMDPSCSFLVCSYSNRAICMYDFFTGEIVARAEGHGEVITGIIFLPDCEHIVSVAGDGCIFVWEVPAPLSSKILQKIKQNSRPSSPSSIVQPASLSHLKFYEEDDHPFKINPEQWTLPESSNPVRLFCQGGGLRETSAFKFSISRLPKWARAKVNSPRIMPIDLDDTSSQVGSHGDSNVQTPSKHDLEGSEPFLGSMSRHSSDTDTSQGSQMPQETHRRSFALDRRWLTIHTVCLDSLNSPGVWDMKDMKMMVTIPTKDPALEMTSDIEVIKVSSRDPSVNNSPVEPSFGLRNHVDGEGASLTKHARQNGSVSASHSSNELETSSASACQEVSVSEVSEQFQSETTESGLQALMEVNAACMKSQAEDLLKHNFGGLSRRLKTEERKSSVRKSYSAQFVLRKDLLRGQKKLFDTPIRDLGGESMKEGKEVTSLAMQQDPQILGLEELRSTCEKDVKNMMPKLQSSATIISQSDSANCFATDNSGNLELENIINQLESNFEGCEKQNTIMACKEALLNLETAAENAFLLFSKLGTLTNTGEEASIGSESQLYSEATEMLPSIAKKVQEVTKLVQSTNISSGKTKADVSSFEPLLGTFAESLSQRVVEILKKNCGPLT
ncbi:Mitogen-activated protein kinase-binding protein 1 [Camellia lanceoleosa]|uniref:Mitogen-activated protein kinase-binding protein 1 n=1 Tax=Camellia lanceoleosa TaxID=1840588 RepID=A0ACC0HRH6_9ERIC|nr:Mitogen-activated protein kinase-binding protein 1 [Camellia lanceoleosa]